MNFRSLGAALILGQMLAIGTASAAGTSGNFAVRGLGGDKCQALTTAVSAKSGAIKGYASWIMGYASAYNRSTSNIFDVYPLPAGGGLVSLVATLCAANPNSSVEGATAQLFAILRPLSLAGETPLVAFAVGGKTISIREESVRLLERSLTGRGLLKEKEGGKFSPQLVMAIQAFQKSEGIAVTGLPDMQTLIRAVLKKS